MRRMHGSGIDRSEWDVIVVGAGAAGVSAAGAFGGMQARRSVLVLSEEDRLPYKRTKISKHIARGFGREEFAQLPADWYSARGFGLALGARAVALDPEGHGLELSDGTRLSWKRLILAGGADPVLPPLPFTPNGSDRVFVVRTAAQVEALREAARDAHRVVVVGTGVLGVEVAEQMRLLGREVVLIGREAQPMPRQLNAAAATRLQESLSSNGVDLRLEQRVVGVQRRRGGGYAVGLTREEVAADLLVFCLGVRPRLELAAAAGLGTDRGILVDAALRTSHPEVFAAGDAAQHPDGSLTHLWHAARYQGELAARSAAGEAVRHDNPPFRLKCEVFGQYFFSMNVPVPGTLRLRRAPQPAVAGAVRPAGLSSPGEDPPAPLGFEQVEEADGGAYRCLYFEEDRLSGVLMVNDRDRAKSYEQAVREGWERGRVEAELPLSPRSAAAGR